jgi:polyhydroxybutyrate depolymerase
VDDVAYLEFLVHHLQAKYDLSPHNAFMVGMSNGGEMCYLMAQKKPGLFAAICSMAGLCLYNMLPITYTAPVPFMEVHGTEDHTSEWCGDPENKGGWGPYLAVPTAISYVVAAAKSTYYSEEELPVKRHPVLLHKYLGGAPAWEGGPATEVWLYEVKGGGHSWAEADMDTFHEIWRFCSRYLR